MPSFPGEGKLLLSDLLLFTSIRVSPSVDITIIWTQTIYINFTSSHYISSSNLSWILLIYIVFLHLHSICHLCSEYHYATHDIIIWVLFFAFFKSSWLLINKFLWVKWLLSDFLSSERKLFIHQKCRDLLCSHTTAFSFYKFSNFSFGATHPFYCVS